MPKTKQQKQEIITKLIDDIKKQIAFTLVDFKGANVADLSRLRRELTQKGARLTVVKKALFQKALQERNIPVDLRRFVGQVAVVFSFENPLDAIKHVHLFSKTQKLLKIVGGYFENTFQSEAEMLTIASLPSREQLLARLAASIASPMSGLLNTFQGNMKGLISVLAQKAKTN